MFPGSFSSTFLLPTSTNLDIESVALIEFKSKKVLIFKDKGPSNEAFQEMLPTVSPFAESDMLSLAKALLLFTSMSKNRFGKL